MPKNLLKRFEVLKKCKIKFDSLLYEMIFVRAVNLISTYNQSPFVRKYFHNFTPLYVYFSHQSR